MIEEDTTFWENSQTEGIPGQMIWFKYQDEPDVNCIYMQIERDILVWFLLFPRNVTFKNVVDNIGHPDYLSYSHIYPEGKGCNVSLLWVERQIEVLHIGERQGIFERDLCDRIQEAGNKMIPELAVFQVLFMQNKWMKEKSLDNKYIHWNGFISSSP